MAVPVAMVPIVDAPAESDTIAEISMGASVLGFSAVIPVFGAEEGGISSLDGAVLLRPSGIEVRPVAAITDLDLAPAASLRDQFEAANVWATGQGYVGGFPAIGELGDSNGLATSIILVQHAAAEFRDLSVTNDLGISPTDDPLVRMRAVQDWAMENGFSGGFPTFFEADHGEGLVYGAILLKPEVAEFAQLDTLARSAAIAQDFRMVNAGILERGFGAAFPTFGDEAGGSSALDGAVLLRPEGVEFQFVNISLDPRISPTASLSDQFQAANSWATSRGFVGGFPVFTEAQLAGERAAGVILIRGDAGEFRDLSVANDLGISPDDDPIARMQAVHNWAIRNGYEGGFPTFFEADHGDGLVYGAILLRPDFAEFAALDTFSSQ